MAQWSKLQKQLYKLISPDLNLQIHCSVHRMQSQYGGTGLPRYWITLDKEIIWDYPKMVIGKPQLGKAIFKRNYPYVTDIEDISNLLREYIDTPIGELLDKRFVDDYWALTNILKAADKRFGHRRLHLLKKKFTNKAARKVIMKRLQAKTVDSLDNKVKINAK